MKQEFLNFVNELMKANPELTNKLMTDNIKAYLDILKDIKDEWYEMPKDVVGVPIDPISGKIDNNSKKKEIFYFLRGTEPNYKNNDLETVFKEDNELKKR